MTEDEHIVEIIKKESGYTFISDPLSRKFVTISEDNILEFEPVTYMFKIFRVIRSLRMS